MSNQTIVAEKKLGTEDLRAVVNTDGSITVEQTIEHIVNERIIIPETISIPLSSLAARSLFNLLRKQTVRDVIQSRKSQGKKKKNFFNDFFSKFIPDVEVISEPVIAHTKDEITVTYQRSDDRYADIGILYPTSYNPKVEMFIAMYTTDEANEGHFFQEMNLTIDEVRILREYLNNPNVVALLAGK